MSLPGRLIRPRACLGIAIEGRRVLARAADPRVPSGPWAHQEGSSRRYFDDPAYGALREDLAALLDAVRRHVGRRYVPIQVALPDPVTVIHVLELDELPGGRRARDALVRWRLARIYHLDEASIAVSHQYLGLAEGRHLLLGLAVDAGLVEAVEACFRAARLTARVIDAAACYRHALIQGESVARSGASLCCEPDYWSALVWDEQGRPRQVSSGWRHVDAPGEDSLQRLATEFERVVLAYVGGGAGRRVSAIDLLCAKAADQAIQTLLAERTEGAATRLVPLPEGAASIGVFAAGSCR